MWWDCPKCGGKVDFVNQMCEMFEEDGSSSFDPKHGITFHTIRCNCGAHWIISLSEMFS